jgi:hypothetical protein
MSESKVCNTLCYYDPNITTHSNKCSWFPINNNVEISHIMCNRVNNMLAIVVASRNPNNKATKEDVDRLLEWFIPMWNKYRKKKTSLTTTLKAITSESESMVSYRRFLKCLEVADKHSVTATESYAWLNMKTKWKCNFPGRNNNGHKSMKHIHSEISYIYTQIAHLGKLEMMRTIISLPNVAKWVNLMCLEFKPNHNHYITFILHFIQQIKS